MTVAQMGLGLKVKVMGQANSVGPTSIKRIFFWIPCILSHHCHVANLQVQAVGLATAPEAAG